jgi:hypothetical protein
VFNKLRDKKYLRFSFDLPMYMADQTISAEWGAFDTVRKGVLTTGWTTGTGGGVPSRDHILVGGQYKLYI